MKLQAMAIILLLAIASCASDQRNEANRTQNAEIASVQKDPVQAMKIELESELSELTARDADTLYRFLSGLDSIKGEFIYAEIVTEKLAETTLNANRSLTAIVLYTGEEPQDIDDAPFEFKTVHVYGIILQQTDLDYSIVSVARFKDCVTRNVYTEMMEEHAVALNDSADALQIDHIHTEPRADDAGTDLTRSDLYVFDGKTLKSILNFSSSRDFSFSDQGSAEMISNTSLTIQESMANGFYDLELLTQTYYVGTDQNDTTSTTTSYRWNRNEYVAYSAASQDR